MDVDGKHSNSRPPSPSQQAKFVLQPTNALAGPSTIPDQPAIPPVYLPPPPERSKPRPPFDSTQDLLSRFQLLSAYDKYVRPYSLPVDVAGGSQGPSLSAAEKGKGKERELLPRDVASPAAQTPGAGGDGDDEEQQGKGEKKWKASYKHMIKGIPGKHSMKKDDYLMTMMQVPPKQRIAITPFDIRTQRDAFSVSLDGLKGWNMNVLVAESPQAREDRKRRKELKKLAKQGGTLAAGTSPAAIPVTPGPTAVSTPGAAPAAQPSQAHPRHGSQPPSKLSVSTPSQPPQQTSSQPSGITPAGVGTPRPVGTPVPPPGTTAPARHTPIPTPAPTPGGQTAGAGDNRRGVKREREESVTQLNGTTVSAQGQAPGVTVSTNGPAKTTGVVLNAKAGSGGVRPRPLKKQRMDTQGQAREMPVQQPTPHA